MHASLISIRARFACPVGLIFHLWMRQDNRPLYGNLMELPSAHRKGDTTLRPYLLGILLVARHAKSEPERASAVPFHEGSKRLAVTLAGSGQDGGCLGRVHLGD